MRDNDISHYGYNHIYLHKDSTINDPSIKEENDVYKYTSERSLAYVYTEVVDGEDKAFPYLFETWHKNFVGIN